MSDANQSLFAVNDKVHVKPGVTDIGYTDIPLGGWEGTVTEVQEYFSTTCLVHWSQQTLGTVARRYRTRCEQDGIDHAEKWMDQNDLEMDGGGCPPVEGRTIAASRGHSERQELESQERWLDEGGR